MTDQSKAKIFLAQERDKNETGVMRSYKTFNSGSFFNEHKAAFGTLYLLNDDTLGRGETVKMFAEEDGCIVFLPVAGGIVYSDSTGQAATIIAGEALIIYVMSGTIIEIKNPFTDALVNYIQMRFRAPAGFSGGANHLASFNIDLNKNQLISITQQNADLPFRLCIAKVEGRSEVLYELAHKNSGVYAYVIEGAFEVQHRLLHERDGLAIWDVPAIEAEALSSNAILLIAEIPLQQLV